jgi:hypothetical protein
VENPLQHYKTKSLFNIIFVHHKFFMCKIQEGDNVLDHVNKVKALADQLACLEVLVWEEKNPILSTTL